MLTHPIRDFISDQFRQRVYPRASVRINLEHRLWQSNALAREVDGTEWFWDTQDLKYVQAETALRYEQPLRCQVVLGRMPNTVCWTILSDRKMLSWELYRFSSMFLLGAGEVIPTVEIRKFEEAPYIAE